MTPLRSSRRVPLGALLFTFILLTGCDEAVLGPTLLGSIDGRVLAFEDNTPIADANVTTSPATGAFVTGENGIFTISDVEAGPYNVNVQKEDFETRSVAVAVRDGETTPAMILLKRSEKATRVDSLTAEITNWSNRVVESDSIFVDVEYRVRNVGTVDIKTYEVYFRIDTDGDPFFQEVTGETLQSTQADVGTFSKFIRGQTAQSVTVDDVWFEPVE